MIIPASPFSAELQIAIVIGFGCVMLLFQAQRVDRRRIIAAVLLIVATLGYTALSADDGDIPVTHPCIVMGIEPYSYAWYAAFCWTVPLPDGK
jgi:hypothetical protein